MARVLFPLLISGIALSMEGKVMGLNKPAEEATLRRKSRKKRMHKRCLKDWQSQYNLLYVSQNHYASQSV